MKLIKTDLLLLCLLCNLQINSKAENHPLRKPLNQNAKELVHAINTIVHGALSMVEHKDNPEEKKEFGIGLHELAHGIADLLLTGKRSTLILSKDATQKAIQIRNLIENFALSFKEIFAQ
ncbi:hypothetical protein IPH25_02725 [bacterium]|nr:MAG: hypothetical protein IPG37_04865 [bacterium]QQR61382.1 MAG: hypothetical protein IPH25_02725 [bacterium]QQR63098.1 MAG: hypothetical protein IPH67_01315 [bacterium]